ncbi:MAG: N-acetylmuramoyl-L-alanine amidase [Parabacteroides sp.]|nr:N-acetylmuramoyl-L-alanine amidase [Parabacteroides sp.]
MIWLCLLLGACVDLVAQSDKFTVVIDAGHGGKDPGARGAKINEKEINLKVALKLGDMIEQNHPEVKVIYTRSTDKFIELDERANIANRNKADLFISIHTNSVKRGSSVRGTETYALGLARTDENLEVAMRENSAILLEDDYKAKYEGFDPNSSESYIIFEFMQNKHLEQSIQFASEVQNCFTAANRADRGVRQAGFLVLRKTSMPSVLIELGFISNPSEEQFMRSAEGQTKLASAISEAFDRYKNAFDRKKSGLPVSTTVAVNESDIKTSETVSEKKSEEVKPEKGKIVFKIQILTSDKKLSSGSRYFKGYKNVEYFKEKGLYKYTYGESTSFNEIMRIRRRILKDFKDAFVVAFKDGQRVDY